MTMIDMRKTKAELHCELLEMVESKGGTEIEKAFMYQYIIEQASKELFNFIEKR